MTMLPKVVRELCADEPAAANHDDLHMFIHGSYANQALILQDWSRLEEAMGLHKKAEALCLELGNKDGLQRSYGNQALILRAWGRLEEAMVLYKKQETLCLELGNKDSLQITYGNQALILRAWGRLEEAMALLKKQETLCLELGNRSALAYCYWNWGLLARKQRDRKAEREKLAAALDIFTELNLPRERDAVRAELEKTGPLKSFRSFVAGFFSHFRSGC
jgi:tetratricopeptide (TPR) repeat protein